MRETTGEARARALVVELAESSPLPPPFPDEADPHAAQSRARRNTRLGLAVAAGTFAAIVGVAGAAWWLTGANRSPGGDGPSPAEAAETVRVASTEVAVVADDARDIVLRGRLWPGDATGIVVVPGYADDAPDTLQVAESLGQSGHTVLFYHLRGQQPSGGSTDVAALIEDLESAIADLRTRGVDEIYVVGYRQSGTAAVALAAGSPELKGVATVFAYDAVETIDAAEAARASTVPLLFIAAEGPGGEAESARRLAEASRSSTAYILSERPPAALSADHYSPKVVRAVLQFLDGGP